MKNNIINNIDCISLYKIPDLSKWNTQNVTDMSYMFSGCLNLEYIPNISKWNTKNVTNLSFMFANCLSLEYIYDISKWKTNNVQNISGLFLNCVSLSFIPDISSWKTNNIINMSYLFSIPGINFKKMKSNDFNNIIEMFYDIIKLFLESKIINEELNGAFDLYNNFFNISSQLKKIPDISRWDISNVSDLSFMFAGCSWLKKLPDISKWNTKNVKNISGMFSGCSSLESIPDISKWNTNKLENVSHLFSVYSLNCNYQDISKHYYIKDKNSENNLLKYRKINYLNMCHKNLNQYKILNNVLISCSSL